MIADFHFLRPWWLLAILAAIALVFLLSRQTDVRSRLRGLIASHLLENLVIDRQSSKRWRPVHFVALLIALGAVAMAGPTWQREQPPFVEDRAPLVLVIDVSQTMDAIDITPSRLERVKLKVQDLLKLRPGGRTAVYAYAGSAHMVLPLTDDADLVKTYVNALQTRVMPVPGKDTAKALEAAEAGLKNEEVPGTLLFLTDGVEPAATEAFKRHTGNNEIMVLGVGTAEGGPVKTGEGEFLSEGGGRVIAKLDVAQLQALGRDAGVRVATITMDDSDVGWIAQRVQSHLQAKLAEGQTRWLDVGWWLTIPIAVLGAFWFRRGWTVQWACAAMIAATLAAPGRADAAEFDFAGMWLTPDQQGRLAFDKGDYAGAAAHFSDPMWRGVALYRAGQFSDAIDAFAQVRKAESYYNQGNALAQLDKLDEAVTGFKEALKLKPDWPQAKANLAIVEKLIAQKKDEEDEQQQDPNEKPDQIQFDDKGKKGKAGTVDLAQQTADMWMRNIQVTPTDLLARRFALEVAGTKR
ncbi:VWA domain-containing protein [Aminobacter sp. AP02]|uniref:vWA domain-containing protein n=1 Tax=Aminobacter sp. AP02 TaxID=2135737 RepID=UPI000D6D7765|nr:VWA domain-containing protein [Aminobacter sp. AP02]PWK68480.1 Ca-activated chloride channel family protein [Aminobacter sp. AP02]